MAATDTAVLLSAGMMMWVTYSMIRAIMSLRYPGNRTNEVHRRYVQMSIGLFIIGSTAAVSLIIQALLPSPIDVRLILNVRLFAALAVFVCTAINNRNRGSNA